MVLGLSDRGQLYAYDYLVSAECSSFAVHDSFVLFTTFSHLLKIVPLAESVVSTFSTVEDIFVGELAWYLSHSCCMSVV